MADEVWQNEPQPPVGEEQFDHDETEASVEPNEAPGLSRGLKSLLTLLSVLVIGLCAMFIVRDNLLVIRHLTVNGIKNVPWQTVALSAGLNASSNYFNLDENKIREGINRNRYLVYLSMEKYFPSSLILNVKERIPAACIRYIGIDYIMADDGLILEKGEKLQLAEGMARISGLAIQDIRVGSVPSVRIPSQMTACTELVKELILQGLMANVTDISFSETGSIYMVTADGFTVHLGSGQYLRAKIGTVRGVLQELRKQQRQGGVIEATVPGEANYRPDGA